MRMISCKKKGSWTKQEDNKLIDYINTHGEGCWSSVPMAAGLERCGKSCRLRWKNYLKPDIKRNNFCLEEEDLIIKLHALLGNRWSLIAGRLPGRTDNEVKNYWNTNIKRKLISSGIDPKNHRIHKKLLSSTISQPQNICKVPKSDDDDQSTSSVGDDYDAVFLGHLTPGDDDAVPPTQN